MQGIIVLGIFISFIPICGRIRLEMLEELDHQRVGYQSLRFIFQIYKFLRSLEILGDSKVRSHMLDVAICIHFSSMANEQIKQLYALSKCFNSLFLDLQLAVFLLFPGSCLVIEPFQ